MRIANKFFENVEQVKKVEQQYNREAQQVTMGFVQVRLEVVAIISSNIAAFVRA